MKRKWYRRNWLGFLEYGLGLLIALGIFYVFVTFYDDWLAFSAFATLLLALAAFLAIRHSSEREKRNRKERLLNEIIEWAIGISKIGLDRPKSVKADDIEDWYNLIEQYMNSFSELYRRSRFIRGIILPSWKELQAIVEELRKQLIIHTGHLDKLKEDPRNKLKYQIAEDHRDEVNKLAARVIDEACKILTEDIG